MKKKTIITPDLYRSIQEDLDRGKQVQVIAKKYYVSRYVVSQIKNGRYSSKWLEKFQNANH